MTRWYVHGAGVDQVVAEETTGAGGGVKWPLADHQGSVRDVVTGSGTSLDHVIYDSFGRVLSRTGTFALRYGYTGRELAEESGTGTYYYRARFYDAGIGRFLSQDPLSFSAGDSNLYRYVGNSTPNWRDPSGLEADQNEPAEASDELAHEDPFDQHGGADDVFDYGYPGTAPPKLGDIREG